MRWCESSFDALSQTRFDSELIFVIGRNLPLCLAVRQETLHS